MNQYQSVDEYIANFPAEVQEILIRIRALIKKEAPNAEEKIRYGMPGYKLNGPLAYFAAYKKHIGFYPTPSPMEDFKEDLKGYKTSKGAIQFQLSEPIPYDLIKKIVHYRVKQLTK